MADAKKAKAADKAARKEERAAKKARRKQTRSQLWQAFKLQKEHDKMLIPLMLLSVIGVALVFFLVGLLWNGQWFMLIMGIALGVMLAMFIFSRRLENSMYDRVGNEPGAAAWRLENLRNSMGVVWRTKTGVAATTHMDAVHRVIGIPGVVLVGEGAPHRLKPLMQQQRKRLTRLLADVPIHEIYVGDGEDQVPVKKLQNALIKLPRVYRKDDVYAIAAKVEAMDHVGANPNSPAGLPKGPLPKGAKMSGMNRRARRMSQRRGGQS
ncbi:DUF4191 family protein [Corynebacterium poyangense]|uniref:DUF4191 family protein n=1 Tax=Corynebacterium poyangense TaxID=2684405 RepID=A0A7H0SPX2_9CORY|nr:DUF4191 domain-containing protein [Corynebacterium poyangense]MBZ8178479.1 DUF4191 family protein [Corynebacterium poyangense]QNQ90597.1 DUF4191 family protein [Corynebacterium poyangense]